MKCLTEQEVVEAYARAWNTLQPEEFLALLAVDAKYASQWVFQELHGAADISAYLRRKIGAVRDRGTYNKASRVRAEIGEVPCGRGTRPCVLMLQGDVDSVKTAVLFEVLEGKITRFDTCIPQSVRARRANTSLIMRKADG